MKKDHIIPTGFCDVCGEKGIESLPPIPPATPDSSGVLVHNNLLKWWEQLLRSRTTVMIVDLSLYLPTTPPYCHVHIRWLFCGFVTSAEAKDDKDALLAKVANGNYVIPLDYR